jgi:hypothetical protein
MAAQISEIQSKVQELEADQKEQERLLKDQLSDAQDQLAVFNAGVLELETVQVRIDKLVLLSRLSC